MMNPNETDSAELEFPHIDWSKRAEEIARGAQRVQQRFVDSGFVPVIIWIPVEKESRPEGGDQPPQSPKQ